MMQRGKEPAGTFKSMAEVSDMFIPTSKSEEPGKGSDINREEHEIRRRLSFSSERGEISGLDTFNVSALPSLDGPKSRRSSAEMAEVVSPPPVNTHLKAKNGGEGKDVSSGCPQKPTEHSLDKSEDKENTAEAVTPDNTQEDSSGQRSLQVSNATPSKQHSTTEDSDAEVVRRAQEEGRVNVVFHGAVTQEGCCRFVSEILKCILYQRQQLPMTYDQLVYSQKKQQTAVQDKDTVHRRPVQSAGMDWRKCQQTLQELEEVLQQLEMLFSLSRVPRVLLLLGGSLILPKELYEINMEALVLAGGDQCLRVSSCLRQLFRTLFVADILSDTRPVRLMPTTVLVLAHRDCGVGWFRPKLQFKVPTRVKNKVIALSTDPSTCKEPRVEESEWQDYVWFQAPMTIKGFSN